MGNGTMKVIRSDVPGQGYYWSSPESVAGPFQIIPTTWGTVEPGPTPEDAARRILEEHRRRWKP